MIQAILVAVKRKRRRLMAEIVPDKQARFLQSNKGPNPRVY